MVKVDTDKWVEKSLKRRAYRDHMRKRFFSDIDMQEGVSEKDNLIAPADQREVIAKLIGISQKNWQSSYQNSAVFQLKSSLEHLGLGLGALGERSDLMEDLDEYSYKSLKSFFMIDLGG